MKQVARLAEAMIGSAARKAGADGLAEAAVYVYAEPALYFHLARDGVFTGPAGSLAFAQPGADRLPVPTFLLIGPHALRSEAFADEWSGVSDRFEKVAEFDYDPSTVVWLNHVATARPGTNPDDGNWRVELYRLR